MWSLGEKDMELREQFQQFRRDADKEIKEIAYHIASLNRVEFGDKIQENFLKSIQDYSKLHGASPYYLHHLLKEYNLYFIAVLFSMINTTKTLEFQHRFCMLAEFLCNGCWTFSDQLSFLKLVNIMLTHSDHLNSILSSRNNADDETKSNDIDNAQINDDNERKEFQNQRFMIYHNFIQWIQNLAMPESFKVNSEHNRYHSHNYPDLDRKRIFGFLNLMILHRPDMFYKLISYLDIARQIHKEAEENELNNNGDQEQENETEVMRIHLGKVYYVQFMNSIVPSIIETPTLYVIFIGRIIKFGFNDLAQNIVDKFEKMEQYQEIKQVPLLDDIHGYVTGYLTKANELLNYLSVNRNCPPATKTTNEIPIDGNSNDKNKVPVRQNLRMQDSEILLQSKKLLNNIIEFIDFFDDDDVIDLLESILPAKADPNDTEDGKDNNDTSGNEEVDRLNLKFYRSVCYTNLAGIAMIEQDFENVVQFAMKGLEERLSNIQCHRYLIAGLITTMHAYRNKITHTPKDDNKQNDDQEEWEKYSPFHPKNEDIKQALKMMLTVDNKNEFGRQIEKFFNEFLKIEQFALNGQGGYTMNNINNWLDLLHCKRRSYGRYSIDRISNIRPKGRCLHSATRINGHQLITYGGMRYNGDLDDDDEIMEIYNDIWILDLEDNTWKLRVPFGGLPNGRYDHSAFIVNDGLLMVIGGKVNKNLHILTSNKEFRSYTNWEDLRYMNNINNDEYDNNDEDEWLKNNKENNGLIHELLFGEYEYNLIDIYDINRNTWYAPSNHNGQFPPFKYLCDHISIKYNNKIFLFPIGSKIMYTINCGLLSTSKQIEEIYWERTTLPVIIPSQSQLMINNGYIQILSVFKQSTKCPKQIITINANNQQCINHSKFTESHIDPLSHYMEYSGCYTNSISVDQSKVFKDNSSSNNNRKNNNKKKQIYSYDFILTHGGTLTDMLQAMTVRQLFDCNGAVFKELVLNITNKIMLIAVKSNGAHNDALTGDDIMWIGKKIQLNDFMDIPNLYGHKITQIGNSLIITGGIGNTCGYLQYSDTFAYVIQSIDEIIENAIVQYTRGVTMKYNRIINSKTYQNNNNSNSNKPNTNKPSQPKQKKPKQPQNSKHTHSNQRFKPRKNKKKDKKKGKGHGKGQKGGKGKQSQNKKNQNKAKQEQAKKQQNAQNVQNILHRQNNIRGSGTNANGNNSSSKPNIKDKVLKDVMRSSSLEIMKVNPSSNGNYKSKWQLEITQCCYCFSMEIYSTTNKWIRLDNNDGSYLFCSMECKQAFQYQQQKLQQKMREYRQYQMQLQQQQLAQQQYQQRHVHDVTNSHQQQPIATNNNQGAQNPLTSSVHQSQNGVE